VDFAPSQRRIHSLLDADFALNPANPPVPSPLIEGVVA
jgi:hypothetical protein